MPKLIKRVTDHDTQDVGQFEDGHILITDEKSAMLVGPDRKVVQRWWKEEPSGEYWDAYLEQIEAVPAQVHQLPDDGEDSWSNDIFEATRSDQNEVPQELLDRLVSPSA